jgi:hypothetical protein
MVTLKAAIDRIGAYAPMISRDPLARAIHRPESWATATLCFTNVFRKVTQDGGTALFGWMFHYREVVAIPGPGYLIGVNHAVWHAPDKRLVDVTPFHVDEKHQPLADGDYVIFLIDQQSMPLRSEAEGMALPSWFFPLGDGDSMRSHAERLQANELAEWTAALKKTEELSRRVNGDAILDRYIAANSSFRQGLS